MSATVHLHIGAPKSGTTSLQAALAHHRRALADDGVLFPGRQIDQIDAALEVLGHRPDKGRWAAQAQQVRDFTGHAAVISMETLCTGERRDVKRAVRAFGGLDVRVVVTARDLARVIPAQWQESTQFRHTWSYTDYLAGVTAARPRRSPPGRSFWSQHDLARILRTWSKVVGADHVTVVTLPKQSGQPDLLWRRFGEAVGIEASRYELPRTANESLGAASAELMRRVNAKLADADLSPREYARNCRQLLAKTVLAARNRSEPKLSVPGELRGWVAERSEQIATAVAKSGVHVVGDLDDLRSDPASTAPEVDPSRLPADEVLDAAVDAIAGLVQQRVRERRR